MGEEQDPLLAQNKKSENIVSDSDESETQDRWWGWVVVLGCFLTLFTLDGICYTFGMFMKPLKEEMGEGNFGAASIGSIQVAVYLSTGPFVARLVTRFGSRPVCIAGSLMAAVGLFSASFCTSLLALLLCYSLVGGLGFGCMYIPGVVSSQVHFTKHRALAVGICVCGTGVGTLVLPPLVQQVMEIHGWRGAMRALSGLCLGSVLCGIVMFPARSPREKTEEQEAAEHTSTDALNISVEEVDCNQGWRWTLSCIVGRALASSPDLTLFLMVMLGDFLATMSVFIPYTHLPDMAMARGVSQTNAAFLISIAGISSTVGRVMAGLLCDQRKLHPMTITLGATCVAALSAFILPSCSAYWLFLILTAGFGLMTGLWVACETPLIIRTLSFDLLTPAFGLLTAGGGLAALTGPPLAGYVEDLTNKGTHDKGMALVICGGIMTSSSLAYLMATLVRKRREGGGRRSLYEEIG